MDVGEKNKAAEGFGSEHHEASRLPDPGSGVAIATTLQDAHAVPDPWAWGHVQLYLVCAIVYMCSTMNGESSRSSGYCGGEKS